MKSVLGKGATFAFIVTVFASAAIEGCSTKGDTDPKGSIAHGEDTKNVSVSLEIAPQANVDSIHYVVRSASGASVQAGDIPVPGGEETFTFGISLPVGGPYTIELTAGNGAIQCNGTTGAFSISSTQQVNITAGMNCVDTSHGDVGVAVVVTSDACPALNMNYIVATPSSANLPDGTIAVLSSATDANGTMPTYHWDVAPATAGTFVGANAQNTTFNCDAAGVATITVTATITTNDGTCDDTLSIPVSCVNQACGNGTLDPGETCDTALDPACPADCTAVCGQPPVEFHEQCEPPDSDTCNATCQNRVAVCGDGFFTPPELCDPTAPSDPNRANCQPNCTPNAQASVCGNNVVEAGELCDPPFSGANCGGLAAGVPGASRNCGAIEDAQCEACADTASSFFDCDAVTGTSTGGPAPVGTSKARLCREVLDCVYESNCAGTNPLNCYCGTGDCPAGGANGACKSQLERALESTSFTEIGLRFGDPTFAGGVAMLRVDTVGANGCFDLCGIGN